MTKPMISLAACELAVCAWLAAAYWLAARRTGSGQYWTLLRSWAAFLALSAGASWAFGWRSADEIIYAALIPIFCMIMAHQPDDHSATYPHFASPRAFALFCQPLPTAGDGSANQGLFVPSMEAQVRTKALTIALGALLALALVLSVLP